MADPTISNPFGGVSSLLASAATNPDGTANLAFLSANDPIPTIVQCIIDPDGKNIIVDVTTTEDHSYDADVSSYPIEAGGDITDNIRIKPLSVKWEAIISDTPISADGGQTTIFGALPQVDAYNAIVAVFKARQTITIQDSLDVFTSMMITSVGFPRSAQNGSALVFTINFVQVEILENQRDTVAHLGGQGSKKLGPDEKAFSRPTSTRASFAGRNTLLVTDHTPPNTDLGRQLGKVSWDHYSVVDTISIMPGLAAMIPLDSSDARTNVTAGLTDGYVNLKTHVYTPIDSAVFSPSAGQWIGSKVETPVTQSPGQVFKNAKNRQLPTGVWHNTFRDTGDGAQPNSFVPSGPNSFFPGGAKL